MDRNFLIKNNLTEITGDRFIIDMMYATPENIILHPVYWEVGFGDRAYIHVDAAVLNSVVNLPKAVPFISRHPVIHAFFDNDEAGRKATANLIRLCPRSEVIDQSHFYRGHKDVNDYLTARIKGRTQKPSTQKNAPETKAVQALRNNLQALKAETAEIKPPRRKGVKI